MKSDKPRVLFLFSRRDFEYSRKSPAKVAKQGLLLESFGERDLKLIVDFHIESIRFLPFSKHGFHISVRIYLLLYALSHPVSFLKSVKIANHRLRGRGRSFLEYLRASWESIAEPFWIFYLSSRKITALLGVMLNSPELSAARKLGIPSFELQHGILSETTLEDYFPNEYPNYFCAWPMEISRFRIPNGTEIVPIPFSWSHRAQESDSIDGERFLLVLNDGLVEAADPFGMMPHSLLDSARLLLRHKKSIVLRFHPKSPARLISMFKNWAHKNLGNVRFETYLDKDIHASILISRLIILSRSTTWLDCVALGRSCVIHDPITYEYALSQFSGSQKELLWSNLTTELLAWASNSSTRKVRMPEEFSKSDFSPLFKIIDGNSRP